MSRTLLLVGNLIFALSFSGVALLVTTPPGVALGATLLAATESELTAAPAEANPAEVAEPAPAPWLPITRVYLPRIQLAAEVVPAPFVQREDGGNWEVPPFRAGHAEYTAGAGAVGNAVLFGHITSRNWGNVFRRLPYARVGDLVQVFSDEQQFDYQVVEVRAVPRTDVSVVQPTETASITLITCTGPWSPLLWDYTQRLVVRAELLGQS